MPFTILITCKDALHESKQRLERTDIPMPSTLFPFYIDTADQSKFDLIALIRKHKPSQILIDTSFDEAMIKEWYIRAIQDTLIVHSISCDIYSFGIKDLQLPYAQHHFLDFPLQ